VTGVSMVVIHEALHEIMLERDEVRGQFLAAFDAFVDESA
jgi:alpha-beta hydrolase superfamily lysophospholipase